MVAFAFLVLSQAIYLHISLPSNALTLRMEVGLNLYWIK